MENSFSADKLEKYLEGKESEVTLHVLEEWFADLTREEKIKAVSSRFWEGTRFDTKYTGRLSGLLDRIHHRIRREEYPIVQKNVRKLKIAGYLYRAAAILFIPLLAVTILKWNAIFSPDQDKQVMAKLNSPMGSRTEFSLPDGSSGWLNGGSTISFPLRFRGRCREVQLSGEAYFDVISDKDRPFVVNTRNIRVKAYGTAFNVSAYDNISLAEVTLVDGEVEVFRVTGLGKGTSLKKMVPHTHCSIDLITNSCETSFVQVQKYTSWKDGKLVFRNDPMETVAKRLEKWYNVEIEIRDPELLSHTYFATFEDESFEEVLRLISLTTPIKYTILPRKMGPDNVYPRKKAVLTYKYGK